MAKIITAAYLEELVTGLRSKIEQEKQSINKAYHDNFLPIEQYLSKLEQSIRENSHSASLSYKQLNDKLRRLDTALKHFVEVTDLLTSIDALFKETLDGKSVQEQKIYRKNIRDKINLLEKKQNALERSLLSLPQKVAVGFMALLAGVVGAVLGTVAGLVIGLLVTWEGPGIVLGGIVGLLWGGIAAGDWAKRETQNSMVRNQGLFVPIKNKVKEMTDRDIEKDMGMKKSPSS